MKLLTPGLVACLACSCLLVAVVLLRRDLIAEHEHAKRTELIANTANLRATATDIAAQG